MGPLDHWTGDNLLLIRLSIVFLGVVKNNAILNFRFSRYCGPAVLWFKRRVTYPLNLLATAPANQAALFN